MKSGWTNNNNNNKRRERLNGRTGGTQQNLETNGLDARMYKNAAQLNEHYLNLARDANARGDRIAEENYLQHAEHYFRVFSQFKENQKSSGGNNNNKLSRTKSSYHFGSQSLVPIRGSE